MFAIGQAVRLKDPSNNTPPLPLAGVTYHVAETRDDGVEFVRLKEDPDEIGFFADLFEDAMP
jgi:hypothetical protein